VRSKETAIGGLSAFWARVAQGGNRKLGDGLEGSAFNHVVVDERWGISRLATLARDDSGAARVEDVP
jgi:hypothetical protein